MNSILLIPPKYRLAIFGDSFPYGFAYLYSILKQHSYHVDAINSETATMDEIKQKILMTDCNILGLGGLSSAIYFIDELLQYARKERPDLYIIIGGGIITANPKVMFDYFKPDVGVIGEGEETLIELMKSIPDIKNIDGIIHQGGKTPSRKLIPDIDSIPFPAWDVFGFENHVNLKDPCIPRFKRATVLSSRSCPFNCAFCFRMLGSKYRKRSVKNVIKEIDLLIEKYNINFIRFLDELFLYDTEWMEVFCRHIIKKHIKWQCTGKVGVGSKDIYQLMYEAGCINIFIGMESGSDKILKTINKKQTVQQIRNTVQMMRDAKITVDGGVIIGSPGETKQTFQQTVDLVKELELPVVFSNFLTPYPGTKMYQYAKEKNIITNEIDFCKRLWNTQVLVANLTDMTDEELVALKDSGTDEIRKYLIARGNSYIESKKLIDSETSEIIMNCKCGNIESYTHNITDFQIVLFICSHCGKVRYVSPVKIPHMRKKLYKLQAFLNTLGSKRIAFTPIGEHTKCLFNYLDLNNLNIVGFLDGDKERTRFKFLGYPVYERNMETIKDIDVVVITAKHGIKEQIEKELKDRVCLKSAL